MELFDPGVRAWFVERFGEPTAVQAQAWPRIAAGEHVLATAPTGCGKTLAALLWSLDRFATGAWTRGTVRVLYVSPLKALNTDVRENLLEPLAELRARGVLAAIDVQVRSGDTPQADRQRMLRRPPEILVTTPESLNLLLASPRGRTILTGVETVILDEIHAVAGNKRGTYLMTAVERLVELAGEFQRVALSATVEPLDTVAAFVGGVGRRVAVVRGGDRKSVAVRVCGVERPAGGASIWPALVPVFREIVAKNRSTLFFVNNRALAERLARLLNADEEEPIAYAHHGSLARELRTLIEDKLKSGALKAVVATSSLELGIDVGALDEVVLVQAPPTTNSAIQRIGRAGHAVGATSRGRIFPTFGRDVLDAAVIAPLVLEAKPSPVRPVHAPLDVLAQVLVAMCGVEPWAADDLYALVRRTHSYSDLGRAAFDGVVAMLRGRYAGTRLRELRPRLRLDPETGRLSGVPGVLPLLYGSGGVIPDRGLFTARVEGTGARLGELDEEFVWERRIGDVIAIGTQTWRIVRITKSDVEVAPAESPRPVPPFWRADAPARDFELCDRIGRVVKEYEDTGALDVAALDDATRESLATFLHDQKAATGKLPHRFRVVIEHFQDAANNADAKSVIIHAGWGARCLRPLAIALAAAWEQEYGFPIDVQHNNDALVAFLPHDFSVRSLLDLVTADNVESLLRTRLERTGFFGARFRENAGRALLLPRMRGRQRMPLWLNRLRAQKLLAAVQRYDDFPVLAETWRACLEDEFDLARLKQLLDEVRTGAIEVHEAETKRASPFAEGVMWRATERHMYDKYEVPLAAGGSALSDDVLREVLHDESVRPRLARHHTALFVSKLQRTAPGYEPTEPGEWVDHVAERVLVRPFEPLPPGLELLDWGRVAAPEQRARIERARAGDDALLTRLLGQFLEGFGPLTGGAIEEWWQLPHARIFEALAPLVEEGRVVAGFLHEDADVREYCDAENLERLLRIARSAARPRFRARPKAALAYYLARYQRGGLRRSLETLFGYPAPAALWEDAILPARVDGYQPADLDALFTESDLIWFGTGERRVAFAFADEFPLFRDAPDEGASVLPEGPGGHDFFDLAKTTGLSSQELTKRLWNDAWSGRATNDTFAALRKGLASKFKPVKAQPRRRVSWQSSRPMLGRWHRLPYDAAADRLAEAAREKDRARQLLARYGVLFRELCAHELPLLRWGRLLRSLRLLELSGEALAGHFFAGVDGLQFATAEAFRALHKAPDDDDVFWLNACDPASLAGTGLADGLPPRVPSNWIVYRGETLVLVARRNGREVDWRADPDDRALALFDHLLKRGRVKIETIDGALAAGSVHADLFVGAGFRRDVCDLVLERRYQ